MPDKAKLFCKDIFGLKLLSENTYALEFDTNGTLLRIIIVQELKPQVFTVLGSNVDDIVSTIESLNEKDVIARSTTF